MRNPGSRTFFYVLLAITAASSFFLLRDYQGAILFSFVLGLLFYPLYTKFRTWTGRYDGIALVLTLGSIALSFLVPLAIAGVLVFNVLSDFVVQTRSGLLTQEISSASIVGQLNQLLARLPGVDYQLTPQQIGDYLQSTAGSASGTLWQGLRGLGHGALGLVPLIFIGIYVTSAVLVNYPKISRFLHALSPLDDTIDSLYLSRIKAMTVSMVRGTLTIAIIQGGLTGLFLWIGGVQYAALLGLLATLASIIPLGAGVIAIPAGIVLIATGHVWQGALQILGSLLIVSNIDNVLRPRLVSKDASLHPALVLLGLFGGIAHFGFLGAVYGPVLMVFLATTVEVYLRYFRVDDAAA